ncbi:MAG: hypothetical protein FJ261_15505 [Planctomycetes bacterium]|nr:hypothetical protein [Planctomycetota bacterium]
MAFSMALTYYPSPGEVLMCDFSTSFREPEMVKTRPVVVVSRKFQTTSAVHSICTVVPVSTQSPRSPSRWHHKLAIDSMPIPLGKDGVDSWAKCDMVVSVGFNRLDKVRTGRVDGKRIFVEHRVIPEDLQAIQACLLYVLNMAHLIPSRE